MKRLVFSIILAALVAPSVRADDAHPLWNLATAHRNVLRVSTLFTAQNVRDHLSTDEKIDQAIEWCRQTGVTRVFLETFRSRYWAERATLEHARDRFRKAGFDVAGCVTTTIVGKRSTGWDLISCYTDRPTQDTLQKIFEYTASMFDLIMIDDFWFTDCECEACKAARGDKSWAEYRCDLMVELSRTRILEAARRVNPDVRIIIKYPQWYDNFHNRGYDVVRQTEDFDWIWVGTETRDYEDPRWGGKVQYEAYYIMRWLGGIGAGKCGGGWFDPYGTTERTYLEQATQTILADAREMLLFCYGSLQSGTGPANVALLREQMPRLFDLARRVARKPIRGVAAPKPPSSNADGESYVYDFVGMMGIPLVPTATVDPEAPAAFYPVHVLKDPDFLAKFRRMLADQKPVLITDGLAGRIPMDRMLRPNLRILKVDGSPKRLLELDREELNAIRKPLLAPFGLDLDAPNKVALYLFGDDLLAVENFNDEPVTVTLTFARPRLPTDALVIPGPANVATQANGRTWTLPELPARTLWLVTMESVN